MTTDIERRLRLEGYDGPDPTASVDAAIQMVEEVLPGWFWRVASCSVSDDAWVSPDFNHPVLGEHLQSQYPIINGIEWTDITDIDLRPAGRPALALTMAVINALDEIERRAE